MGGGPLGHISARYPVALRRVRCPSCGTILEARRSLETCCRCGAAIGSEAWVTVEAERPAWVWALIGVALIVGLLVFLFGMVCLLSRRRRRFLDGCRRGVMFRGPQVADA